MKFVSWNVNGLRACITKGFLEEFSKLNADFFCLQETKLSEGQLQLELPGYHQYWCYADKKGYSGTAIFTKHTPQSVSYGIGVPELDNEGRVITLEYQEFYLVTCYTPNAQRGLTRIDHRMKWDEAFRDYLKKLDSVKPVIICGDLNVAHQEIDLKNPKSNRGNAGFSDEERESFQKTLDLGFTDTFRHLHPDATGRYSWWSYMYHARENNAGWRIDYFLVSDRLKNAVYQADIHSEIMGSDHCPVSLDLDITVNGGIWSPSSKGDAKQLYPEEKAKKEPKNEPKASANSAKALVAFVLLFALFLGGMALLNGSGISVSYPEQEYIPFTTKIYYSPLNKVAKTNEIGTEIETSWTTISDGNSQFYIHPSHYSVNLENRNAWFCIELTEEGKTYYISDWQPQIDPLVTTYGSDGYSLTVVDLDLVNCIPYYTDTALTEIGGWLIYGWLEYSGSFQISLSADSFTSAYSEMIELQPFINSDTALEMSTAQLVCSVLDNEDIISNLSPLYVEHSGGTYDYDFSVEDRYYELLFKYPILSTLSVRSDAVEELMNTAACYSSFHMEAIQNLLSMSSYRTKMTPVQEAQFLTGYYSNSLTRINLDGYSHDYSNWQTADLVAWIIGESNLGTIFQNCLQAKSRYYIYEYLCTSHDLFIELYGRMDAASMLLHYSLQGLNVCTYLLSLDTYSLRLSADEAAKFIGYVCENFDSTNILGDNISGEFAAVMTTEQLANYIAQNTTLYDTFLNTDYILLGAVISYEYLREDIPALMEFESREDAVSTLLYTELDGDRTLIEFILDSKTFRSMMTDQQLADFESGDYVNKPQYICYG